MRRLLLFALLLATQACWSPRAFTPRERVDAVGPGGVPAALYPIPAADAGAASSAEVRVWSQGAQARYADDDREITELHIGFELENNGDRPLQLDLGALACEDLMIDGLLQEPLQPVRMDGDGTALPGRTARVDVLFEPATTHPRDIETFRIRFVVRDGEREVLRQVAPFGPWTRPRDDDPYWQASYGWGWGWGWGWNAGYGPGFGWAGRPYW
jgi:hypothetical protein